MRRVVEVLTTQVNVTGGSVEKVRREELHADHSAQ